MTNRTAQAVEAPKASRRSMLFASGGIGAAAAVLVAAKATGTSAEGTAAVAQPAPANGGGYHVTDHIKQYYATTLV